MKKHKTFGLLCALGAPLALAAPAAQAERTLTMVYPLPDQLIYTQLCKELAGKINEAGKGTVQINQLPFGSIGMFEQPTAVRAGRVDMMCVPANIYARALAENEAMSTASVTPAVARERGGIRLIDEAHQKHFGTKYIGWTDGGAQFRIYMRTPPKWNDKGLPDLAGVKLRDNPIYGAFFQALGGTTHSLPPAEVFSALEQGVVDAAPWPTIGLPQLKWDQFLRHAVEPDFYQTDIGWTMNLKTWESLDPKARKLIEDAVIQAGVYHTERLRKMAGEERAQLEKGGMTFHKVPAAEAYLELAMDSAYDRMRERLKDDSERLANVDRLRAAFQE